MVGYTYKKIYDGVDRRDEWLYAWSSSHSDMALVFDKYITGYTMDKLAAQVCVGTSWRYETRVCA